VNGAITLFAPSPPGRGSTLHDLWLDPTDRDVRNKGKEAPRRFADVSERGMGPCLMRRIEKPGSP
jgi:hypothetical protein